MGRRVNCNWVDIRGFMLMVYAFKGGVIPLGVMSLLCLLIWAGVAFYSIALIINGKRVYNEMGGAASATREAVTGGFKIARDNKDTIKQVVVDNKDTIIDFAKENKDAIKNFAYENKDVIVKAAVDNKDIIYENREIADELFRDTGKKK
jgi:hypothetical protein